MSSYCVEQILEERENLLGHVYVLVKWVSYPDTYNSLILKKEINRIDGEAVDVGSSVGRVEQIDNFVSDSDVLAKLRAYRKLAAHNYADVVVDSSFYQPLNLNESNYLLIWNYSSHLYLICILKGLVYVADGVDAIHRLKGAQRMVSRYV